MNAPDRSIPLPGVMGPPPLEEPLSEDPRVLALVVEYQVALDSGRRPDREALLAAHPDLAPAIIEFLDALEFVRTAAASLHLPPGPVPGEMLGEDRKSVV